MALAVVSLGSIGDTTARSDKTCSVFRAPAANTLVLVTVLVSDTAGTPAEPSAVSGSGLIFSLITSSVTYNTIASALHNLSIWGGMGSASIVSSVITAHFANNNTGCAMQVAEVSGVSTSGTSGANAVGKSVTSRVDTSASISGLTILPPSATSTANGWYAVGGASVNASAESMGESNQKFTRVDGSIQYATPTTALYSAWTTISSGDSLFMGGGGVSNSRGGIMVELVLDNPAAAGGKGPGNYYQYYLRHVVGDAA